MIWNEFQTCDVDYVADYVILKRIIRMLPNVRVAIGFPENVNFEHK